MKGHSCSNADSTNLANGIKLSICADAHPFYTSK